MRIVEILALDHARNHPNSSTMLVSVEEILTKITEGYQLYRADKTVIIHKYLGSVGDGVEFHCYNAGSGEELAQTVLAFMAHAREHGASWCVTPYQNQKINELFAAHIPAANLSIVETATGFEATVRL